MKFQNLNQYFSISKLSVGKRLTLLTGITALALLVIASLAAFALTYATRSAGDLHRQVENQANLSELIRTIDTGVVETLNGLNSGSMIWSEADQRMQDARQSFMQNWQLLQEKVKDQSLEQQSKFQDMQKTVSGVTSIFDQFSSMGTNQSRPALELFLLNDLGYLLDPFRTATKNYADIMQQSAQAQYENTQTTLSTSAIVGTALILLSIAGSLILARFILGSILIPVNAIAGTVSKVQQGDTDARTNIQGTDELSRLGAALDQLLNEKVATLIQAEKENEVLNNSVIELLEGTAKLSDKDLTTRLTVREDITGPVADALNMVTKETSEALGKITHISKAVGVYSVMVDEQTHKVVHVAAEERAVIEDTINKLESLSRQMNLIAKWCQSCNQIAKTTAETTDKAYEAVGNTVESMGEIRESISETEKRIKRLSERSQEISGIIDIINNIAERTHVLALNASMQAAAAGEAGRGFAVVADEVQRLAESSRNATSQISALVRNIQTETADAVDNMNSSITQVVSGSKRATQAGEQMQETQKTATDLLDAVEKIARSSLTQAKEAQLVRTQADSIEKSTHVTDQELKRQSLHTERLRTASTLLQQTVEVFRIPEAALLQVNMPELLQSIPEEEPAATPAKNNEPTIPSSYIRPSSKEGLKQAS
ncbi:methyl-accepting chemotaxis protein [Hahella sp. CCB-MM4]|uniref:methyl-accepting chemotaxis protein n=1 Tax=Hahella sp. (strain CCB-MM4) TaxID=1926491 RepID=UPI000B9BB22F|nr:HAMP domain-containing methyl-accepting chemotaxis protein [Hahella sp. CCB-MM4]OZG72065.1 methyl-accepting chemotaxis protein [Hahella sp. CCB-MM4]